MEDLVEQLNRRVHFWPKTDGRRPNGRGPGQVDHGVREGEPGR